MADFFLTWATAQIMILLVGGRLVGRNRGVFTV